MQEFATALHGLPLSRKLYQLCASVSKSDKIRTHTGRKNGIPGELPATRKLRDQSPQRLVQIKLCHFLFFKREERGMWQEPRGRVAEWAMAGKIGRNRQLSTLHRRIFVTELQIVLGAVSNARPAMDEMSGLNLP